MRKNQKGMSLAEVLVAVGITAVMIFATMTVMSTALQTTHNTTDKQFATQKAISILEELKALVQVQNGTNVTVLDAYDDGTGTSPLLTVQNSKAPSPPAPAITLTQPGDPISGNTPISPTKWTFERRISVQLLPGLANDVRLVNVKMFKNTPSGLQLLAEVASVIRTVVTNMPPTQVYDVYCIAVENVPGWWVYMSNVVPFVRNAINDLQSRNPGLVFRTHWITTLSYGRDQEYAPYVNDKDSSGGINDSTNDINSVYFYPGAMPAAVGTYATSGTTVLVGDDYYYPPFFFTGHVMIDTTDTNNYVAPSGTNLGNPFPYALADQYNHSMRYYDELTLYNARLSADPSEEKTYRLLLDDMFMNPANYKNALLINLHGELLPFPPLRNYSDATKNPESTVGPNMTNVRAVVHPEQLRYINTDSVTLRVYSYLANGGASPTLAPKPIKIRISGLKPSNSFTFATANVKIIHGGVDQDGIAGVDAYDTAPVAAPTCPLVVATQMCFTSSLSGNDTIITLYNSPLVAPQDSTGRGLAPYRKLYSLDYIPSPVEDLTTGATQFSTDLSSTSDFPKNTARWMLTIPSTAFASNEAVTVETRFGDQLTSGVLYPPASRDNPANLSRTYFWRGDDTYIFGDQTVTPVVPPALPITERYQFQGDPRDCPYADLKRPHKSNTFPAVTGAYESALGMGFNPFFDDFEDGSSNRAAEEWMSTIGETYNIGGSSNTLTVRVNGAAAISAVLVTGGSRTAANVCSYLNALATFNTVAYCDAVTKVEDGKAHVRVTSKIGPGTLQFGGNAAAVLGFDLVVHSGDICWKGWKYSVLVGATTWNYGIKNNGTAADDGWNGSGYLEFDVHRVYQVIRSALVRTNAIWTTLTGYSYYYIGIGNEIGYDAANSFNNSIPISTKPYTGASGAQYEDTIIGSGGAAVRMIRENGGSGWWAMPWIGEIYPDTMYNSDWKVNGNLPTGVGALKYIRTNRTNFPQFSGTDLINTLRRTGPKGCTTLFWEGTDTSTFHHIGTTATSTIQAAGTDIANNYSFPIPASIPSDRPFDIDVSATGNNPDNFLAPGVYPAPYNATILNQYYQYSGSSPRQGAALVTVTDPANYDVSFIAVNGLSPTGTTGTNLIARWSFLSLIQSYLNGGLYTDTSASPSGHHVRQVPRLTISSPNVNTNLKNPASVLLSWGVQWLRWDGLPYTTAYSSTYSESGIVLKYKVMYSTSNGIADTRVGSTNPTGWYYCNSGASPQIAYPGVKPDAAHELTATSYTWSTPATSFPEGTYILRVETYREGYPLHYAFHQYRAYLNR